MASPLAQTDRLLRLRPRDLNEAELPRLATVLFVMVALAMVYGAVMGTFGGLGVDRLRQIAYSATKVPLLLIVTFLICLPSYFVINTLMGLRGDFGAAFRALLAAQAVLGIILASLAPYTALWYLSVPRYRLAILFNGAMFALASFAAQVALRRLYRPLVERDRKHRLMAHLWLALYVFVGIQMAWVLRPYVGDPNLPTEFFREDSWTNAYVAIMDMIWEVLQRR
jgi:hypothetical protein